MNFLAFICEYLYFVCVYYIQSDSPCTIGTMKGIFTICNNVVKQCNPS